MERQSRFSLDLLIKSKEEIDNNKSDKIEAVLDANLLKKNDEFRTIEPIILQTRRVLYYIIFSALFAVPLIMLKVLHLGKYHDNFLKTAAILFCSGVITYLVVSMLYEVIYFYTNNYNDNIYTYMYNNNMVSIKTFISSFLFCILALLFLDDQGTIDVKDSIGLKLHKALLFNVKAVASSIACLSFLYIVKEMAIQSIQYRIHKKFYYKRIVDNEKIVLFLQRLNELSNEKVYPQLDKWASHIFNLLSKRYNSNTISKKNFVQLFGPEDGDKFFHLFDVNNDEKIEIDEFISRYVSLYKERENLHAALYLNDGVMDKLEMIFTMIMFPLSVMMLIMIFFGREFFAATVGLVLSSILGLSFAFSGAISEIFNCIIFIYFIRPFDVGDMIMVDDMLLEVDSLGLSFSNFYEDGIYHSINNLVMKQKDIINLRELDTKNEEIVKKFDYDTCYDKLDEFKSRIAAFISKNRNKYDKKFHVYKFKIEKNVIEMTIEINIICRYQEIRKMYEKRDLFVLHLDEIIRDLKFVPRHHF